jgi:NAD(P)-dependent dehydrogenase (short-subunit alcohol dehydrogenase family)
MSYTRTVLITGGTLGLGFHAALDIARQHPEYLVVIASRKDTDDASARINKTLGQKNTVFLPLDLSNLAKVRSFVSLYESKKYPPIEALVLNAGIQFPNEFRYSDDKIEMTFAVNHVGHALLFHLLFPHLADDARIVVTASGVHDPAQKSGMPDAVYTKAADLARKPSSAYPPNEDHWQRVEPPAEVQKSGGRINYCNSKLANILWMYALNRRLQDQKSKHTVNAFDPGLMPGTGLAREYPAALKWLWYHVMPRILPVLRFLVNPNIHSANESGASLARLAVGTDVKGVTGLYFEGRKEIPSSVDSHVKEKQEELWEWTLKTIANDEGEREKFELVKWGIISFSLAVELVVFDRWWVHQCILLSVATTV